MGLACKQYSREGFLVVFTSSECLLNSPHVSIYKYKGLFLNVFRLTLLSIQLLYSEHIKCHSSRECMAKQPMTIIIIKNRATFTDYSFLSLNFGAGHDGRKERRHLCVYVCVCIC